MAADEVSLYNMALNAVGTRDDVSAPNEVSREAEVCRLWFEPARNQVLRAAPWPCALAFARLAVLAERDESVNWTPTDPNPGWHWAYAVPDDLLTPRFSSSYSPFDYGVYGSVRAVMSNEEAMILAYTKKQTIIPLWDAGLYMAVAYALAAYIAMPLTGKQSTAKRSEDQANALILSAREASANDSETFLDTVPDWISARGYACPAPTRRFFFPYGAMISFRDLPSVS